MKVYILDIDESSPFPVMAIMQQNRTGMLRLCLSKDYPSCYMEDNGKKISPSGIHDGYIDFKIDVEDAQKELRLVLPQRYKRIFVKPSKNAPYDNVISDSSDSKHTTIDSLTIDGVVYDFKVKEFGRTPSNSLALILTPRNNEN